MKDSSELRGAKRNKTCIEDEVSLMMLSQWECTMLPTLVGMQSAFTRVVLDTCMKIQYMYNKKV